MSKPPSTTRRTREVLVILAISTIKKKLDVSQIHAPKTIMGNLSNIPVKDMSKKDRVSLVLSFALFMARWEDHTCVYLGCEADEFSEEIYGGHSQGCPVRNALELADTLYKEQMETIL